MSIYRALLRNTSNALSPRVSSEQIRLQVPPKGRVLQQETIDQATLWWTIVIWFNIFALSLTWRYRTRGDHNQ